MPFSRSWKALEKGGCSKGLCKRFGFLLGKVLKYPEIDKA